MLGMLAIWENGTITRKTNGSDGGGMGDDAFRKMNIVAPPVL